MKDIWNIGREVFFREGGFRGDFRLGLGCGGRIFIEVVGDYCKIF